MAIIDSDDDLYNEWSQLAQSYQDVLLPRFQPLYDTMAHYVVKKIQSNDRGGEYQLLDYGTGTYDIRVLCFLIIIRYPKVIHRRLTRSFSRVRVSIDVPFILHFFQYGFSWEFPVSFSVFWSFIDYALYGIQFLILSRATIGRHILIFHDRWLLNRKRRFFIHYLSLMILILYSFIYYCIIIYASFCPYIFYRLPAYGVLFPCIYYYVNMISIWELVCHQTIPIFIIIIFRLSLLIRILWQKSRLHRSIHWRKQRKMTIQLLSVSMLFITFSAP
ncbi:unnamed protein product [Rotaria sp. Silwood1]|nr:unnamed protein product [Rotaria sp. Silwood1]